MNTVLNVRENPLSAAITGGTNKVGFNPKIALQQLEERRIIWETTEYRKSNIRLYGVLADCHGYAGPLGFAENKLRNECLKSFFKDKGYRYDPESPLITRVLKAVFGDINRRRISTYSIVIRQAIKEKVIPSELPNWIERMGGVQEIKLARNISYITPSKKVDIGKDVFDKNQVLANVKSEALSHFADADLMGETCLFLAEQQSDASFDIKAIIRSSTAINTAFMSLYKLQIKQNKTYTANVDTANEDEYKPEIIAA